MFENAPNNSERLDDIKEELSSMDSDKLSKIADGSESSDITMNPEVDGINEDTIGDMAKESLDSRE